MEQLSRLKRMAESLEKVVSPHTPSFLLLSNILKETSNELDDLQKTYVKCKSNPLKMRKKQNFPSRSEKGVKVRPGRLGKFLRVTLSLQLFLLSLAMLAWVTQPQCCDTLSTISFSPQLKFVNGPPPI